MKYWLLAAGILGQIAVYAQDRETYPIDSASVEHPGIPKGELLKFTFSKSTIYPGTTRDYWIYIPAQYNPSKPACVYVNQDGVGWKAPTVFDNLIHKKLMPVTIGVFVMHGRVKSPDSANALDRFNRSYEYDGLGDDYAKFLLGELLPDVEKHKATDGRPLRLSKDGNDRAIGGASSGAVCAFTAAWEHPEAFSRVFSAIGTYVGLRGADRYPTLIRKTEPKPIRIYLQDGTSDLNIYGGDWWKANETMERALTFSGYEVNHNWGEGGHNGQHGTALFPEAMRWLWKDWPNPVNAGKSANKMIQQLLPENLSWEKSNESANPMSTKGFTLNNGKAYTISDLHKTGLTGICASPDQTQAYSIDSNSHWVWIHSLTPDGGISNSQRFGWLHTNDDNNRAEAEGIACDTAGNIYVATNLGVQILDQLGRVNAILPVPDGKAENLWFAGPGKNILYILCSSGVYMRRLNTKLAVASAPPVRPASPHL